MKVIDLTVVDEEDFNNILYMSPPLGDKVVLEENIRHHPMCGRSHHPPGCLHWTHLPWVPFSELE